MIPKSLIGVNQTFLSRPSLREQDEEGERPLFWLCLEALVWRVAQTTNKRPEFALNSRLGFSRPATFAPLRSPQQTNRDQSNLFSCSSCRSSLARKKVEEETFLPRRRTSRSELRLTSWRAGKVSRREGELQGSSRTWLRATSLHLSVSSAPPKERKFDTIINSFQLAAVENYCEPTFRIAHSMQLYSFPLAPRGRAGPPEIRLFPVRVVGVLAISLPAYNFLSSRRSSLSAPK